jgi:lipopolysaccharide heptosyltransferase II
VKVLILKPSSLGDVIHALPVLRLLKKHLPSSEIYWWLDVSLVPLLEKDPDLTGIIPFQRKSAPHQWPRHLASIRQMRGQRFDWAIDLQGLARSAIFAWLANAGLTVGLDNLREGGREGAVAFYDITPPRAPVTMHSVDRYLAVLPLLGVPVHKNFEWMPARKDILAQVQEKWKPGAARWIALMPGGRWDNKRWPAQNFADLVKRMGRGPDTRFVVLGSKDEFALGEAIAQAAPEKCLNLAGATSLLELIEWIRLCQFGVTNDSGPMHIAAAVGTPVVAIFGPTNPVSTGPYGQLGNVLQNTTLPCVPCMSQKCAYRDPLACLHSVTPGEVCQKASQILPPSALSFA